MFKLVDKYNPLLKKATEKFDFENPQMDPKELAETLAETMIEKNGVGLAAPQVGLPYSVFVVGNPGDKETIMAFFNPTIVDYSEEQEVYEEGCLSFPGLFLKIKRPKDIRMRFTDASGETATTKYSGFTSRAIQHEYDHLLGVIYTSKANSFHLHQAKKNQKLIARKRKRASIR